MPRKTGRGVKHSQKRKKKFKFLKTGVSFKGVIR